jgi:transposase
MELRTVRYMSTLCATQCKPVIKDFYKRLVMQGKYKKVALTACMRKGIAMFNGILNGVYWHGQR